MSDHPFDNDGMVVFDHWVPTMKTPQREGDYGMAKFTVVGRLNGKEYRKDVAAHNVAEAWILCKRLG